LKSEYEEILEQLKSHLKLLKDELRDCLENYDYKRADHFQKAVWIAEQELRLKQGLIQRTQYLDGQEIDMAIVEMDLGLINGFDIVWEGNRRPTLHFGISSSFHLYCEFPSNEELENPLEDYIAPGRQLKLTSLGFIKDSYTERLRLYFDLPKNKSCIEIKEKLAILLFEVLQINHDFIRPELKACIVKHS
jgi:hypothetical protein